MDALKAYRPDIDGMRAIAVLSVVAYHYGLPVSGGYVGVDVFFVISGYLIGSLIYREARAKAFSYRTFYVRRARRIVPALLAVLVAAFVAMSLVATPGELRDFGATAVAAVFSVSNIALWRSIDYFRPTAELNPLLMTWSLGVEEQFYLLAPLLLLLLSRLRGWRVAALGGVMLGSLGLGAWAVRHEPTAAFFLLPTRAWELAAGVLLGVLELERVPTGDPAPAERGAEVRAMAGIALIVLPALCYDALTPFPGVAAVPPVLGTVMLLGAGSSLVNRRVLGAAPMRFFGLISYSLYLWHWPLISLSRMVLVHEPTLPVRLGLLAIAVALAWASYRYIEQPFRHGRVPAGRTLWRFAGAMGLVAALTGSAVVLHGYPQRWPASYLAMSNTIDEDAKDPCLVVADATPRLAKPCVAPGAGRRMVAVVGDSHAAALAPGIRVLAERAGLGVAQLTKASCPFLVGVSRRVSKLPGHFAACARFDRRVLRVVRADQRIGTVIIAGAWRAGDMRDASYAPTTGRGGSPDELLERGLSAAVAALRTSGKQVVIVRDVPYIRFMPKKRLAACASRLRAALNGRAGRRNCDVVSGDEMERDAPALAVLDRVASETGAILVDPRAALCDGQTCRIALDGRPLYRDQQHLTRAGAVLASAAFADALTAGAVKGRNRLARSPPIAWRPR